MLPYMTETEANNNNFTAEIPCPGYSFYIKWLFTLIR